MTSEAQTPKAELAVSGAGPLTSFTIGVVLVGIGIALRVAAISPLLVTVLAWLGVINLILAVFNVLPGTPLDGGRLLHAFVWSRHGDRLRATRTASRAGEGLGAILIATGLIEFALGTTVGGGLWLALLGWFLRAGAQAEETHAETNHALEHATVADVMTRDPSVVPAWASAGDFVDDSRRTDPEDVFPVEDHDGTLVGVISARQLRLVPRSRRTSTRIADLARPLTDVPTFRPDEPATALLERTERDDDGLALVLDGEHLVGAVSRRDLARAAARINLRAPITRHITNDSAR